MISKDPGKPGPLLITKRHLCICLQLSEASIDRWQRTDPTFPQAVQLGLNSTRRRLDEVKAFINSRPGVEYDDHAFSPVEQVIEAEIDRDADTDLDWGNMP